MVREHVFGVKINSINQEMPPKHHLVEKLANICLLSEKNYSNAGRKEKHRNTCENNWPSLFLRAKKLKESSTTVLLESESSKLLPLMPITSTALQSTTGLERLLPTHFGRSPGLKNQKQPAWPMIQEPSNTHNKYPTTISRHWYRRSMRQLFLAILASVCLFTIGK